MGHGLQFGIPLRTKTPNQGLAQEFINGQAEFAALLHGRATDIPTMVIEADEAALELLDADGIEGARDGFTPFRAPFSMSPLGGAEAATCRIVAREYAVLAANNADDEVAFLVRIGHALCIDDG